MFRARMTEHQIQEPVKKVDSVGFAFEDYDEPRAVLMYVTQPTQTDYNQNEFYAKRYDAIGFTFDAVPQGSLVDGEYKVDSVTTLRQESVLNLMKVGGDDA